MAAGTESIFDKIVMEKELTTKGRKQIKKGNFAIPEKAPKSGSYPIHDIAHARNALARVSQHGSPDEQKRVRAAVRRRYPSLKESGLELAADCKVSMFDAIVAEGFWDDDEGGHQATELLPMREPKFKSLEHSPPRRSPSTERLTRPAKPSKPTNMPPAPKPGAYDQAEDGEDVSIFDDVVKKEESAFDAIVNASAPKSMFDDIVEANQAPKKSMFDDICESADSGSAAAWDDRVARTLHLSEELVSLRNEINK